MSIAFPYRSTKEMKSIAWLLQGEKSHCRNLIEKIVLIALAEYIRCCYGLSATQGKIPQMSDTSVEQ